MPCVHCPVSASQLADWLERVVPRGAEAEPLHRTITTLRQQQPKEHRP